MADAATATTIVKWKDNPAVHPSPEEIAKALQDTGKAKKRKEKGKTVEKIEFTEIEKLANATLKNIIKAISPAGVTVNSTRARKPLVGYILMHRKHQNITDVDTFFHKYGKDGMVYIIKNDKNNCGLDIAIQSFQEHTEFELEKKNVARTPNDGLRLGIIMLDCKHRDSVAGIMTKKKQRKGSDQSLDPTLAFFEKILDEDYLNQGYIAGQPAEEYWGLFPEDEKENWNPNDSDIFQHKRSREWMKGTWEDYLRTKYKKALDRWNKDTGGGDGTAPSFIDYCAGDRWLVWIFCMDMDANFLLASNAGGRMPRHLQVESGFEDLSSISNDEANTQRAAAVQSELEHAKKQRVALDATLGRVVELLDKKNAQTPAPKTMTECIDRVDDLSNKLTNKRVLDSMSPNTQDLYKESIEEERRETLKHMWDKKQEKGNADTNDDD